MHHLNPPASRRPEPLRRLDRYALMATLARKTRTARLSFGKKRHIGHIRAWPRAGGISFRVDGGVASGMGLPDENATVELRFRMRGLSFRCEGRVRKVDREQGRLMVKPDCIEWCASRVHIEGQGMLPLSAMVRITGPDRKHHEAQVIAISDSELRFVCWPCPNKLDKPLDLSARLRVPGLGQADLTLRVHSAAPVFPGSHGRIMTAELLEGDSAVRQILRQLAGDARSAA